MWTTEEGSTGRLLQLCAGYFIFYVITGVMVKYFLGSPDNGFPGMSGMQYLVYSTAGGTMVAAGVVLALRWYRLQSNRMVRWGPLTFPGEFLYIIPSGVCTAVVIPTTTLMYSLEGLSVMVAMTIMRGSVILISRVVDAVQIRQGILTKRVYLEENLGVIFALAAVGVHVVYGAVSGGTHFDFLGNPAAMVILSAYIIAYSIRIYIMNYYKNTRPKGERQDNKGFFAIEQIAALSTIALVTVILFQAPETFGWKATQVVAIREAITEPAPLWAWAILGGTAFGAVSFFSVFIFMFKGRTATFAGLVNRLTSLIAGTAATLIFAFVFGGRLPNKLDWLALLFIFIAVGFLTRAERRRAAELAAEKKPA
jgi:hypothetical protein